MRSLSWLSVLVAVTGLCVGCADPSLDPEADQLRADVAGLPGVTSARLDYTEPVTLDSGKLALSVEMSGTATPDQVVAVTETAYRAFASTHQREEADLAIRAGHAAVALRAFEPDASVGAVSEAVRTGLLAAPDGGSVTIDLTTDDVPEGDHVAGTYLVGLPAGSTFAEVPPLLGSLAAHQPDRQIGWGGAAADGSALSYDSGLPPAQLIARWERMQRPEAPLAVRAFEDGALLVEARVRRRYDVEDPADRRALDQITRPQLRALGDGEWAYTLLGHRGTYLAEIDRYVCMTSSEGPYDDELEAWVTRRFGPCEAD
ncbi:hypothetical protein [Nocardioides pantholopis]|uniref:hypothetical protein n=1 Tax=Nocardioides pantholopis TaxID=2483798 RepID=UPI000FD71A80|nr:hypothetical protein [Nocardioides pantholopis]